jgi:radical SAM protein with 4Fe4S-binding SPASM domain
MAFSSIVLIRKTINTVRQQPKNIVKPIKIFSKTTLLSMDNKENPVAEPTDRSALRRIATFSDKMEDASPYQRIVVTPFEKNKILTMYPVAKKILEGEMVYPLMAVVYPSYVCNHNCQGCSYRELNRKENVFLDPKNFVKLLRSLRSLEVKSIELSGGGEPTSHPQFCELAEGAVKEGFDLALLTNGFLLSGRIADVVVDNFTYVRVSVDANDGGVYNQIHRPPEIYGFQTILNNLEEVISKRNQRNSKLTVGAKVLVCQTNMNFIESVTSLAKDIGCDYVQFEPMRNTEDSLFPEQIARVDDLIKTLQERYYPFSVCGGAKGSKTNMKCWLSPIHILVDPLGDVYPCSHYQYRRGSTRMGNLFRQPLEKIWFGSKHKEVIRDLKVEECNLYDCRWHYYNEIMWQVIMENKMHLNFL